MPRPNATALSAPRASVHPSRRSSTPRSTSSPYARAMPSDTSAYASRLASPSSRAMATASSLDAIPAAASPPTAHMKPRSLEQECALARAHVRRQSRPGLVEQRDRGGRVADEPLPVHHLPRHVDPPLQVGFGIQHRERAVEELEAAVVASRLQRNRGRRHQHREVVLARLHLCVVDPVPQFQRPLVVPDRLDRFVVVACRARGPQRRHERRAPTARRDRDGGPATHRTWPARPAWDRRRAPTRPHRAARAVAPAASARTPLRRAARAGTRSRHRWRRRSTPARRPRPATRRRCRAPVGRRLAPGDPTARGRRAPPRPRRPPPRRPRADRAASTARRRSTRAGRRGGAGSRAAAPTRRTDCHRNAARARRGSPRWARRRYAARTNARRSLRSRPPSSMRSTAAKRASEISAVIGWPRGSSALRNVPTQEHALIEDVAHDVGEQLGRGLVRPLQVLEPEHDRRSPGEVVEEVDERLHEHDRLDVELRRLSGQQGREHRLGRRHVQVLQQVVQRGAHRQEPQRRRQLDARARADAEAREPAAVERRAEQRALADPCLAADEQHPRPTTRHLGDGIVDPLQFRAATDERRSGPHGRGFYERPRDGRA